MRAAGAAAETDLQRRIHALERELAVAIEEKERHFGAAWASGKMHFTAEVTAAQRRLKVSLPRYLLDSNLLVALSAPLIYAGFVPFVLLDIFLWVYQGICFPLYGIPKARRCDYLVFDRGQLKYLNLLERFNCLYCSYGNGLGAFLVEVAGRTEQHWCPIKHAKRLRAPHSRYGHFLDYGDAAAYRQQIDRVRFDFVDLRELTPEAPELRRDRQ